MADTLVLDIVVEKNNKAVKCQIEVPYLVAKKEMEFATLIVDIGFFPEKYRVSSGYAKKILNEIYGNDLTNDECETILNTYRGTGIMCGEICKGFDEISALFINHCLAMCQIDNKGKLLQNTFTPKIDQAMYKMLENNNLLYEIYQYRLENDKKIKTGKINLSTMQPKPI